MDSVKIFVMILLFSNIMSSFVILSKWRNYKMNKLHKLSVFLITFNILLTTFILYKNRWM